MKLFKILLFLSVLTALWACNTDNATKHHGMNPFQTTVESDIKFEIDGVECKIIEKNKSVIRLSTDRKLSVEQMKSAKKKFPTKDDSYILQFFLAQKTNAGQEYAAIDSISLFLFDANIIIDLKTNTFTDLN